MKKYINLLDKPVKLDAGYSSYIFHPGEVKSIPESVGKRFPHLVGEYVEVVEENEGTNDVPQEQTSEVESVELPETNEFNADEIEKALDEEKIEPETLDTVSPEPNSKETEVEELPEPPQEPATPKKKAGRPAGSTNTKKKKPGRQSAKKK